MISTLNHTTSHGTHTVNNNNSKPSTAGMASLSDLTPATDVPHVGFSLSFVVDSGEGDEGRGRTEMLCILVSYAA